MMLKNLLLTLSINSILFADFCSIGLAAEYPVHRVSLWGILDDHRDYLPGTEYYNRLNGVGGYHGFLSDAAFDNEGTTLYEHVNARTAYKGTATKANGLIGLWYALAGDGSDNYPLNFSSVYHPVILPQYQPKIIALEIKLSDAYLHENVGQVLQIELKDSGGDLKIYEVADFNNLVNTTFPSSILCEFDANSLQDVVMISWALKNVGFGDSLTVDQLRLKFDCPSLKPEDEFFLYTLGMLLQLYDESGIVNDRLNFPPGEMENITATGKLTKILAMGLTTGLLDEAIARNIIVTTAETMLRQVERGPAQLWSHFTSDRGINALSEYASGDTAYAAMDLAVALSIINEEALLAETINYIESVDWLSLKTQQNGFSHGYRRDGTLIEYQWAGAGMETMGVLLAAHAGAGLNGSMNVPPSYNGSGFIWHCGYPISPTGVDVFGNDWLAIRKDEVADQINFYLSPDHEDWYYTTTFLYGLSAAEVPTSNAYAAYGLGGSGVGPNYQDVFGKNVIVPHYSAMSSSINPSEANYMWRNLRARGLVSPLNVLESASKEAIGSGLEILNPLHSAWNLSLSAEGWLWAMSDVATTTIENFYTIPEFADAANYYFPGGICDSNEYSIAFFDGNDLKVLTAGSQRQEQSFTLDEELESPQNPFCDGYYLWFDACDKSESNRRRVFRMDLVDGYLWQKTRDEYGSSYDSSPVVSGEHFVFQSNRSGQGKTLYANNYQGNGFGEPIGTYDTAVWDKTLGNEHIAFLADDKGLVPFSFVDESDYFSYPLIPWDNSNSSLNATKLSMSPDGLAMLISTSDAIYIKNMQHGDLKLLLEGASSAVFSDDGRCIVFVQIPTGESDRELYWASISSSGELHSIERLTYNESDIINPVFIEYNPIN